jgi:hypothetical protein
MENLEHYYEIIENCIRSLSVDPALCRGQKPGQWDLKKGSASVWIDVWRPEGTSEGYIQAMAPVVKLPATGQENFFREILEINHQLYGVGMTLFEDWVYVKTVRELNDLSQSETLAMLNRIGHYADEYDDFLQSKYHPGSAPAE